MNETSTVMRCRYCENPIEPGQHTARLTPLGPLFHASCAEAIEADRYDSFVTGESR